jgi:hypothetical protein
VNFLGITSRELRAEKRLVSTVLGCLGIVFLFACLRWNSYDAPLTRDEGEYAYSAWLLKQGIAPYQHAFLQKPPMIVYTYLLAELLAPGVNWFPRVIAYLFAAASTLLLGAIARREFGPGSGLTAMWLLTPMILLPGLNQFIANTEMFLLLPLLGTIAIYVFARGRSTAGHWLAAGFLAAIALLYKFTIAPLLVFVFAVWSYEERSAGRAAGRITRDWQFAAAGGLAAAILALGFFVVTDGARSFWDCVLRFNRHYASSGQFNLAAARGQLAFFWSAWWILFLLPLALVGKPPARIWYWLVMLGLAFASSLGSFYGHYYVPAMPFWALVSAVAIGALVARFPPSSQLWIRRGVVAGVVALICWPNASLLALSKRDLQAKIYPYRDYPSAARQLAEITSPNDLVLVAGSEPQILYYARRQSSTRFVLMYPLMMPTPLAAHYHHEAVRELQEHPPAAVVLARYPESWLTQRSSPTALQRYIDELLRKDFDLAGGYVSGKASWQAPLPEADLKKGELLLFRRKTR